MPMRRKSGAVMPGCRRFSTGCGTPEMHGRRGGRQGLWTTAEVVYLFEVRYMTKLIN
jgi:hypothetical protein